MFEHKVMGSAKVVATALAYIYSYIKMQNEGAIGCINPANPSAIKSKADSASYVPLFLISNI